jgi:hypothetical protein
MKPIIPSTGNAQTLKVDKSAKFSAAVGRPGINRRLFLRRTGSAGIRLDQLPAMNMNAATLDFTIFITLFRLEKTLMMWSLNA